MTPRDVTEFVGWPPPPWWVWAAAGLAVVAVLAVVAAARTGPHHAAASPAARTTASAWPASAGGGPCGVLAPGGMVRLWNPATGPPTGGVAPSPVCLPGPISARGR